MPVPVWVPGQLLSASDVSAWMVPNGAYKTSATSRNSSIVVLTADPDLQLGFPAGGTWVIEAVIQYHGPAGANINWAWQTNATAISGSVAAITNASSAVDLSYRSWTYTASLAQTTVVSAEWTLRFNGLVTVPTGVASALAFAWVQGTPNATPVTVDAGSYLLGWRAN